MLHIATLHLQALQHSHYAPAAKAQAFMLQGWLCPISNPAEVALPACRRTLLMASLSALSPQDCKQSPAVQVHYPAGAAILMEHCSTAQQPPAAGQTQLRLPGRKVVHLAQRYTR